MSAAVRPMRSSESAPREPDARTRILDTAYSLFSRHGIQAVGVDRIVAEAGVAKMTLYRHFPSKGDLALAFLELRAQRWTFDWLGAEIDRSSSDPLERLLAAFAVLDGWFRDPDFESCPFVRTLLEAPERTDPLHAAAARHLDTVRAMLADQAERAGLADADELALQLQTLMMGSIVSATRGDADAALRAGRVAERLLETAPRN